MWKEFNPNPTGQRVGDCTVRAISCALGQSWVKTYIGLCLEGLLLGDMPSSNRTWGAYLEEHGYKRRLTDASFSNNYTVEQFAEEHPQGIYILAISGHVVCLKDGAIYDSWDSSNECPIYYWCKE